MKTYKEAIGDTDVTSLSHRHLSTILNNPSHPHHAAAKAEVERRNMSRQEQACEPVKLDKIRKMISRKDR